MRDARDGRAARTTALSLGDTIVRQGIQFAFSVVLARLLVPEDFGLLAMLYVFTGLASAVAEGGLGAALIQRIENSPAEESSVFAFNALIGLIMALLLWVAAGPIEALYARPGLGVIAMAMGANVFINALGSIHSALIIREGRLGLQLQIGFAAGVVSGLVAVTLAWKGYGAWALVAQTLVASMVSTVLLWTLHGWRPTRWPSMQALRPLLGYGSALMAASLLDAAAGRLYTLLVGRVHGAAPLGLYMRAVSTQQLPHMMLNAAMRQVAFPQLAAHQADRAQLRTSMHAALRHAMLLHTPCVLGIAATAEWLVPTLFGPRWNPSVPILQVLCIAGSLMPLHHANLTLLKALGHSSLFLRLEVLKKAILVALLLMAIPFGLLAIAWAQVLAGALAVGINARYSKRLIGYGFVAQARDAGPYLLAAVLMALVVAAAGAFLAFPGPVMLVLLAGIGVMTYLFLCATWGLVSRADLRRYFESLR